MTTTDHRPLVAAQRRERMRSRLLQAAFALAAESGIGAVTVDAVITRAEVARGSFYKYFETPQVGNFNHRAIVKLDVISGQTAQIRQIFNDTLRDVEPDFSQ